MKKFNLIILFAVLGEGLLAQNLIQNPSFDQNDLEINCSVWYNGCGEALTLHCDTNTYCLVGFSQQSPSVIPENRWSVKLDGGSPNGVVVQHLTALQGNFVFKLEAWLKAEIPTSTGMISLGKTENGQYLESKNKGQINEEWALISMTDTISLSFSDTLTVLLAAELGDFIFKQVVFDDISLEIIETLNTTKLSNEFVNLSFDVLNSIVKVKHPLNEKLNLYVYNLLGQEVYVCPLNQNVENKVDLSFLNNAMYLLEVKRKDERLSQVKIVKL